MLYIFLFLFSWYYDDYYMAILQYNFEGLLLLDRTTTSAADDDDVCFCLSATPSMWT